MKRSSAWCVLIGCLVLFARPVALCQQPPPPKDPADIRRLIDLLGADRFAAREKASTQLTAIGRPAVPALREATIHPDAEIRMRAERILALIQSSIAFLVENLKDPDVQVRRQAAFGLERIGPAAKPALASLVEALRDDDEGVRDAAVGAVLAIEPQHQAVADVVPSKAHVNGKYRRLLRRLKLPEDQRTYSEYREYGFYQTCDWAGHRSIPAGFWVYVYPYWYIWGELVSK